MIFCVFFKLDKILMDVIQNILDACSTEISQDHAKNSNNNHQINITHRRFDVVFSLERIILKGVGTVIDNFLTNDIIFITCMHLDQTKAIQFKNIVQFVLYINVPYAEIYRLESSRHNEATRDTLLQPCEK